MAESCASGVSECSYLYKVIFHEECDTVLEDSDTDNESEFIKKKVTICSLFLRDSHEKLSGFMDLLMKKDNVDFFKLCRITKSTFNILANRIEHHRSSTFNPHTGGKERHSSRQSLALTLWYLGRQSTFQEISEQFGISIVSTYRTVQKTINIINKLYSSKIKWPSIEEISEVERNFKIMSGFVGVIGAIDGCHIKIKAPEKDQKDYLDRTFNHSINLLAVCNAEKKFTYIYAGFPGSAHDQRVFSYSKLGMELEKNYKSLTYNSRYHLIGDSAFTLKPYMMVPFKDTGNLNPNQIQFNLKLSRTRRVIENSFAWLKCRFRRLKFIDADIDKISHIVTASCILHNITLEYDEERLLIINEINDDNDKDDTASFEALSRESFETKSKYALNKRTN